MKHLVLALAVLTAATSAFAEQKSMSKETGQIVHSAPGEIRISKANDSR